jgi:hypothetical protein
MRKRKVRCYKGYASIEDIHNIEVFYTIPEMYNIQLFTCLECGEIFVIDFENPGFLNKSLREIVGDRKCPKCNTQLKNIIEKYPESFKHNSIIGNYIPTKIIPPDEESEVREFFEIQ